MDQTCHYRHATVAAIPQVFCTSNVCDKFMEHGLVAKMKWSGRSGREDRSTGLNTVKYRYPLHVIEV